MSFQLRPGTSSLLSAGTYSITMYELRLIYYKLYADDKLSLWQIKERHFDEAQIEQIAVAIKHASMDIQQIPYDQRPSFSYDPSAIDLSDYRVGKPSQ